MMKKLYFLLHLLFLSLLCGCLRVNTDPRPFFEEVAQDVDARTGETVCWDHSLSQNSFEECINERLNHELTLEDMIYIALLNNRQLQSTYENLGIASAQFVQAGLLPNPIFAASDRFSTNPTVTDLIDISLLQNCLELLLIPLKKKAALSELEATKARVTAQILEIIAQTKIAFYSYQAQKQMLDLKTKILLGAESSYEAAQKLFEKGNIKELEVVQYKTFYEQTKIEIANLEVEILNTREHLNVLMGLWGTQICWISAPCLPSVQECPPEWNDIENCAISQSLDLEVARRDLCATAAGFGIDTSRIVFPQLDMGLSTERDEGVWFVGPAIAVGIPFFDFGQANSATAHAEILRQWNMYTALAIEIRSVARLARINLLNTHRQALYYQSVLVPLAEQQTTLTLLQHNAMQLGVFQLLAAKIFELEQKIQAVEMTRDYWIAHAQIELILNGHLMGK